MTAASIRARVRAELTDEIKQTARRHLASDGANLSLRAVARDLGMASSAVYRYFASRDDLLTALIIDAYAALGASAEAAEAAVDRADPAGRWAAVCHAVRDWALANPHEYALIYGSPVPGYRAPEDTIGPAIRIPVLLGGILHDAFGAAGSAAAIDAENGGTLPDELRTEITLIGDQIAPGVAEPVLARGLMCWIHVVGAVSFELFGQLNNTIDERRAFFDFQVRTMAALLGIAPR